MIISTSSIIEKQLLTALEAFSWAYSLNTTDETKMSWAEKTLRDLEQADIDSIGDLATGCRERTLNLDLALFGRTQWSEDTIGKMESFLPGPIGLRTFRLAQHAAARVENGTAATDYVHRPESGKLGNESFCVKRDDEWVMHVDCAGFIRNCLKYSTKSPFVMALSDRDFMRAKDFFAFFKTIPNTVLDGGIISDEEVQHMKWRLVPDLRMVVPGDIIVYRPRGRSAGGAAFTENDRKDLAHILKAVRMAQLWEEEAAGTGISTRNVARDPELKPWVKAVKAKMNSIGIKTVGQLKSNLTVVNSLLEKAGHSTMSEDTLSLVKSCVTAAALNTGHIVFCSGPAVYMGSDEYRIRVVHSTKFGKPDKNGVGTTGVQEHYRRFTMVTDPETGKVTWTRKVASAKPLEDDEDDNPTDDMEEEDDDELNAGDAAEQNAPSDNEGEEQTGMLVVDVLAARMCF